jgi:hypothetical protein
MDLGWGFSSSFVIGLRRTTLVAIALVATACGSTVTITGSGNCDPGGATGGTGGAGITASTSSSTTTVGETASTTSSTSTASTSTGVGGNDGSKPETQTIDPTWERTNEYFLAPSQPNPDLQYYGANTSPLFNDDDSPAGSGFTWTSSNAWNGPDTSDMPVDGTAPIPGFVAGDTWFWTLSRAGCTETGTTYWFRANVDLGTIANLTALALTDKYHPGRLAVNEGLIVFVNGVPQPVMPNVSAVPQGPYGATLTRDDTETGWSFASLPLSLDAFHDGSNEIAIMFDERCGDGGLGHLALAVTNGEELTRMGSGFSR